MAMIQIKSNGLSSDELSELINAFDIALTAHVQEHCDDISALATLQCVKCEGRMVCNMLNDVIPYLEQKFRDVLITERTGKTL